MTDGDIGHVEELIVDTETWEIRYLVIDTKNWWPGKKVIISPKWVSTIDWDDKRVGVDLTREDIKSAPEYDSKVPVNRDYETHLFDYYGRPYYWSQKETVTTPCGEASYENSPKHHDVWGCLSYLPKNGFESLFSVLQC